MKLVYEWPHRIGDNVIGVIRRFMVTNEKTGNLEKIDIPFYNEEGGKWVKGIPAEYEKKPLFGLNSFKNTALPIVICEGQKTQTAWRGMGFQAVTLICGSNSAELADWDSIKPGHKYWLAPDNDDPGEKFAEAVWQIIHKWEPQEIGVIRLPGLPHKGDIVEWLQAQPELKDWNGYDPIEDFLSQNARELVKSRLDQTIAQHFYPPPSSWVVPEEWQEPIPLDTRLRKVKRLTVDLIPAVLRPWILDAQSRMGCPLEYLAVAALTTAAAAIGTSVGIRPKEKDAWTVICNLWALICGPVGSMKTPALQAAMQALQILDNKSYDEYSEAKEEHEKKVFAYEQKNSVLKEAGKNAARGVANKYNANKTESPEEIADRLEKPPAPPKLKRFIVNDATVPAMIKILSENERGVLLFQDELYNLLKTWDQEGRQSDRPFYLQAHTGNLPWIADRISNADERRIKAICVSILGGMQPDTIGKYLIEAADDQNDGIIQRFQMMVYLDKQDIGGSVEGKDEYEDYEAKENARLVYAELATMDWTQYGAHKPKDPEAKIYYKFSPDGQAVFKEWKQLLKEKIELEENPYIEQHLNKYESLFASLALIFHCIELSLSRRGGDISRESAQLAADWCAFLEYHARRVYEISKPRDVAGAMSLAEKIKRGKLKKSFGAWRIQQMNWRGLKKKEEILAACKQLVELNWLRQVTQQNKKGGPPKIEFLVNPKIEFQC